MPQLAHQRDPAWQQIPATRAAAVTPADSDLATNAMSLWVGGAGNVRVTTVEGDDVTFNSVPAGTLLRVQVERVWSTSTTATNIVALWVE